MMKYAKVVIDAVLNARAVPAKDVAWDYLIPSDLNVVRGSCVVVPFGKREIDGFVVDVCDKTDVAPALLKPIHGFATDFVIKPELLDLLPQICDRFKLRPVDVLKLYLPSAIRAGKPKRNGQRRVPASLDKMDQPVILNPEQQYCVDTVLNQPERVYLLKGVTGSGKTEVYMHIIQKVLDAGKTALVLVPEIGLTPQVLSNFKARFGDVVAMLHSKLGGGEKYDEWLRADQGSARIVIGARSAVFAPLENLGAIIIDEEHDGSYQSDSNPRYLTHDIAIMRGKWHHCPVVLGSATPSIQSFYLAEQGEYQLLELTKRVNDVPLPKIELVDMGNEIRSGNGGIFGTEVLSDLIATLRAKHSAMIFLNRRGYSQTVRCLQCGWSAKCENCDVSMVYHKDDEQLKCHYCAARMPFPERCPKCGSTYIKHGAMGTQKICAELEKLLKQARVVAPVLRMDTDNTQTKGALVKILDEFAKTTPSVLVGTQMIAKGHHFPQVSLVIIVNADGSFVADYRSAERTFALLTQVAGRAGRAVGTTGKVYLQTYMPKHYVYKFIQSYDYLSFYQREITERQATKYPPFATIVRVLVSGTVDTKIIRVIKEIMQPLRDYDLERQNFIYLGAMKCPYGRLQNKYRYQILARIRQDVAETTINYMYECVKKVEQLPLAQSVKIFFEINPASLS
ncbi:MAG: primosomal protein N' [Eubacteriales bacterium]|nr:primosomal protein N' [Eubacteriales bacterium]